MKIFILLNIILMLFAQNTFGQEYDYYTSKKTIVEDIDLFYKFNTHPLLYIIKSYKFNNMTNNRDEINTSPMKFGTILFDNVVIVPKNLITLQFKDSDYGIKTITSVWKWSNVKNNDEGSLYIYDFINSDDAPAGFENMNISVILNKNFTLNHIWVAFVAEGMPILVRLYP